MFKKDLKSLKLNKKSISNLDKNTGGVAPTFLVCLITDIQRDCWIVSNHPTCHYTEHCIKNTDLCQ